MWCVLCRPVFPCHMMACEYSCCHTTPLFGSASACPPQTRPERTDIGTLLIPDVTVSDSGTYMCVGSNSIGSNSAPIKVIVLKGEKSPN